MGLNNLFGISGAATIREGRTISLPLQYFAPSAGFGTITQAAFNLSVYRFGDRLVGAGQFQCGTVAASACWFNLPAGLTLNKSYMGLPGNYYGMLGSWVLIKPSTAGGNFTNGNGGVLFYDGGDTQKVFLGYESSSGTYTKDGGTSIFTNSSVVDFKIDIPIAEWST